MIVETYGAGNMLTDPRILEEIKCANDRGILIVNVS